MAAGMAGQPEEWMVMLALVGVGMGLYGAWRSFRRARMLADTPTARIRSAPQGYVELQGRAGLLAGDPIIAPLSGMPCAWYRYQVEEKANDRKWRVIDKGVSDGLFLLIEATGHCIVDPDGAEVIKTTRDVWYGDASRPRRLAGMEHGIPQWLGALSGKPGSRYRYTEQRIIPGEDLHVLGLFCTLGGSSAVTDTHREVGYLLEAWKKDPRRMALFDRNGNGRIDPDEWEAARQAAHRHVDRAQRQRAIEPDVHRLSNPGDRHRPFLISTVSEHRLIRRYQCHTILSLLFALVLGGYLAWTLA